MRTRPFEQDPAIPGPGSYDLKTFVDLKKNDNKNFSIGKKEAYEFRKSLYRFILYF